MKGFHLVIASIVIMLPISIIISGTAIASHSEQEAVPGSPPPQHEEVEDFYPIDPSILTPVSDLIVLGTVENFVTEWQTVEGEERLVTVANLSCGQTLKGTCPENNAMQVTAVGGYDPVLDVGLTVTESATFYTNPLENITGKSYFMFLKQKESQAGSYEGPGSLYSSNQAILPFNADNNTYFNPRSGEEHSLADLIQDVENVLNHPNEGNDEAVI